MVENSRQRILTFALVGQGLGGSADPISALFPFLAPIANDLDGQVFNAVSFRSELRSRYGISLSRDVTEVFVSRLMSLKLLQYGTDKTSPLWRRHDVEPAGSAEIDEKKLIKLIDSAKKFHAERQDTLKSSFDEEAFLGGLMEVLLAQQQPIQFAVEAVEGSENGVPLNKIHQAKGEAYYLASEYISWSKNNDKDSFDWAAELAGAVVVSEALIEIRTPTPKQNVRPDLTVYLDTPILMEFLGCSGKAQLEDTKYIINSLRSQGVGIGVLEHSVEELKDNLRGVMGKPPTERRGPTATALLRNEVDEEYINSVINDPKYYINDLKIKIISIEKLDHLADKRYFSTDDEHNFFSDIQGNYNRMLAAERDAASIAWVIRRRKGVRERDPLKSKHVLLTRNALLYQRIRSYSSRTGLNVSDFVGPVLMARDIAGILWLIMGQNERLELSRRQLLLQCQRARINSPQIVSDIFRKLNSINQDNAELFWASVRKPLYLSYALDAVHGSPTAVTEEAAEAILERIRADLVAEERRKSTDTERRLRDKYEQSAAVQAILIDTLETDRKNLQEKNAASDDRFRKWAVRSWRKNIQRTKIIFYSIRILYNLALVGLAAFEAIAGTDLVHWSAWVRFIVISVVTIFLLYAGNVFFMVEIARLLEKIACYNHRREVRELVGSERLEDFALSGPIISRNINTL